MPTLLIATVGGFLLFVIFLVNVLRNWVKKAASGRALVKTGVGLNEPSISRSSLLVIPLLHKFEEIDLTVKTVRIDRRGHDSLSCADGIRAEVEVDFYIQINPLDQDIRRVAMAIGCERASNIAQLRELFEAKFADALKTAGSKLTFDQLYQNRAMFRDEILMALGQTTDGGDLVLNGYKLDDVAIQYLEQLPLEKHNEQNVLDARGKKVIAERTSSEAEAANERLRQKEITIQEQNQRARTRELEIKQDIALKEAKQEREVAEARATQQTIAQQTIADQERLAVEANIEKERSIRLAEERKQQEITSAQIARERATQVAEQAKQQEIEIAKIQREVAQAEATKEKIKRQEEIAKQEAERIRAEEQANTVRTLEVANRAKQAEVIQAEKDAAVASQKLKVDVDVRAYELTITAKAKLESAELDAQAAEKQAKAILEVNRAQAEARRLQLEAENLIGDKVILANALRELVPLLPEIIHQLMKPAEKIDSIKVLNITGLEGLSGNGALPHGGNENGTALTHSNPGLGLIQTLLSVGMFLPLLKEVGKLLSANPDLSEQLKNVPGGEQLAQYLQQQR